MNCPTCKDVETKVIDSRLTKNNTVRRRRQCVGCESRFSTIEEILKEGISVIKRDGRREEFDRNKILSGLLRATQKRPVTRDALEDLISDVVRVLNESSENEINGEIIGNEIMKRLKNLDQISYVRFASVYKDFRDIGELADEISNLNMENT